MNFAKFLRIPILKNTCLWLLLSRLCMKYLFLGIWMLLPNLFKTKYIWIFSVFKVGIFIEITHSIFRSSRSQMFFKNRCFWKFRKLHRKTLKNFIKKRLWHWCFPVKFAKFLQHLFCRTLLGAASEF